jgi:NAD(P)-dependent dehydrogenase (short-subunit alcohol dehydrogenase family)
MQRDIKNALVLVAAAGGAVAAYRAFARLQRQFEFAGKTVLITGGSRGLGLVLAREFAREGARLAICSRDPGELERAQNELVARGASVLSVPCDITDRQQVDWAVQTVTEVLGPIDVLVNNAGMIQVGPFEVTTIEDYETALRTHFWGPLFTTLAVLPSMRQRATGRIVNVSSVGGKISTPHLLPYAVSKFALTGFSEGLRAELADDGVFVTTVIPGLMRTGSARNALFKGQNTAEYAWFSVADALPGLSMSAESAASRIVNACRYGDAEIILSLPAQVAVRFHGLFPAFTNDLLAVVDSLLPQAGGAGTQSVPGRASESAVSRSWVTTLSERAAERNNELASGDPLQSTDDA